MHGPKRGVHRIGAVVVVTPEDQMTLNDAMQKDKKGKERGRIKLDGKGEERKGED